MSKPTAWQRRVLEPMADGAVITVHADRRWVLKLRNDVLRPVSTSMRKSLRREGWVHSDYVAMCYRITVSGRSALAAATTTAPAAAADTDAAAAETVDTGE